MTPPCSSVQVEGVHDDLNESGRRAFVLASKHVALLSDPERYVDAVLRFARAIDMVEEVRYEWIQYGRPKLYTHSNGALVPHPLVRLLAESEKEAARCGRELRLVPEAIKRAPGRPLGSTSAPDRVAISAPPVIELRDE